MNNRTRHITGFFLIVGLLAPIFAHAQDATGSTYNSLNINDASSTVSFSSAYAFQSQGVFGCSLNGSYAMSVGALSALGGAYVPVNDASVTLNTGYLVYKECVLREVVDAESQSAITALDKQTIAAIQTGRNGNPLYVQSEGRELSDVANATILQTLQGTRYSGLSPAFQGAVKTAFVNGYEAALNGTNQFTCPYTGDLQSAEQDPTQTFSFAELIALSDPRCDPLSAYYLVQNDVLNRASLAMGYTQDQWNWSGGYYARTDNAADPLAQQILTPSSLVGTVLNQAVTSGFTKTENANDIGQMVGALFAGLGTQIVADNQGLAGVSQPVGGQPSYLDQVAAEASTGLRDTAVNAAITILNAAQQVEQQYFQIVSSIANTLTQTITQIRGEESQCWTLIIQKVCATPLSSTNTCTAQLPACTNPDPTTCPVGITLKVATSTAFSQPVIQAQIAPLATSTAANLTASQNALNQINQLIQGVTNTTSLDAQRVALEQLDTLVAQHALHTQIDLQTVQGQQSDVQTVTTNLVQTVAQTWGDGTPDTANPYDPNSGWCNVSNPTVIQMWENVWKQ